MTTGRRTSTAWWLVPFAAMAVAVCILAVAVIGMKESQDRLKADLEARDRRISQLETEAAVLRAQVSALVQQLNGLGITPVITITPAPSGSSSSGGSTASTTSPSEPNPSPEPTPTTQCITTVAGVCVTVTPPVSTEGDAIITGGGQR